MAENERFLKKVWLIEIIKKLQNLRNEEINDMIWTVCLVSNKKSHDEHGKHNKGIIAIMRFFGNAEALC